MALRNRSKVDSSRANCKDCLVKMNTKFQDETKITLKDPLVWIDLEMTGLDISKDQIIEIAVVLTDSKLLKKIRGPNIVI